MVNINKNILLELHNNHLKNNLFSPIWIVKSEIIFHKGKYFAKIFFYKNVEIIDDINGVTIELTYNNQVKDFEVFDFKPVESYNDSNMFGAILELSNEYDGSRIDYKVKKFYTKNGPTIVNQEIYGHIELNSSQLDLKKNEYLKHALGFTIFPSIHERYWLCRCGKINDSTEQNCVNCSAKKSEIANYVDQGIEMITLKSLYKDNPISKMIKTSTGTPDIPKYLQIFRDLSIKDNKIVEFLQNQGFIQEYLKLNPLKISSEKDAETTISEYIKPLVDSGFNVDEITSKYTIEDVKSEILHKKRKGKKVISLLVAAIVIIVATVSFYTLVFVPMQNFNMATQELERDNYEKAIELFELSKYKNYLEKIDEANYMHGNYLMERYKFSEAIEAFQKSKFDDYQEKIIEVKYRRATFLGANNEMFFTDLESILGYKDSEKLYYEGALLNLRKYSLPGYTYDDEQTRKYVAILSLSNDSNYKHPQLDQYYYLVNKYNEYYMALYSYKFSGFKTAFLVDEDVVKEFNRNVKGLLSLKNDLKDMDFVHSKDLYEKLVDWSKPDAFSILYTTKKDWLSRSDGSVLDTFYYSLSDRYSDWYILNPIYPDRDSPNITIVRSGTNYIITKENYRYTMKRYTGE